ncbi:MAG: helix-turn-helix domain-containing protein, partial [Candidatus Flemingiibacterium sp.]
VYSSERPAVFIHRPYCLHKLNAEEENIYSRFVIFISKKLLADFPTSLVDMSVFSNASLMRADPTDDELDELVGLCRSLEKSVGNYWNPPKEYDPVKGALTAALVLHEVMKICASGRGEVSLTKHSYIQDVLQLVTENFAEQMTIDELCVRFGVGRTKFAGDFCAVTGSTYKKYMTDLRQTRARELLESGSSIINASLETGYSSEAHFIKAFREYWGVTPGEFKHS